jgi:uncharacterized membrane protein YphA (DoxX/SURF4 family)
MTNSDLNRVWWSLRLTFGLVAFLAGADKFLHILTDWDKYLSPSIAAVVPVDALMAAAGVTEMLVGILILLRWTRLGAYLASGWLLCISLNLILGGSFLDVAVRDLAMSVGAWTLAKLTEMRETAHRDACTDVILKSAHRSRLEQAL